MSAFKKEESRFIPNSENLCCITKKKSQHYFIKFTPEINKIIGCPRATLIFGFLEHWSTKMSEGFYKFIEPCNHPLYRKGDSWTEELNCDSKSFAKSFQKIGVRYRSRSEFEKAQDKFQGKLYLSYYDRHKNQTFFIRNDEAVKAFLSTGSTKPENTPKRKGGDTPNRGVSVENLPTSITKTSRSCGKAKNASNHLSKDKSHASNEMIQKMVEIWEKAIEGGKNKIELTNRRIAFLKKALADKFDQLVEKWEEFCLKIASSKFLMGEKTSFKATLDWALKFDNIQKILEGCYGIGDRTPGYLPVNNAAELQIIREDIAKLDEPDEAKEFRAACLKNLGAAIYRSWFQKLKIEWNGQGGITLVAPTRFHADCMGTRYQIDMENILALLGLAKSLKISVAGEARETLSIRGDKPMASLVAREHSRKKHQTLQKIGRQDESSPILPIVSQLEEAKANSPAPETKQPVLEAVRRVEIQRPDTGNPAGFQENFPFQKGKFSRSYIDTKNTPNDLSKDKSHAGNETAQKMIEVWNTAMGDGKLQTGLTDQRVACLGRAWEDKFGQSLEKWETFCRKIASSKFLMGEKTSFKATLDWALKFDNIDKILEGNYGMDRMQTCPPANNAIDLPTMREEIAKLEEPDGIKGFRLACLEKLGAAIYRSWFQKLAVEWDQQGGINLVAPTRFHADCVGTRYQIDIKNILVSLGVVNSLTIAVSGEGKEPLPLEDFRVTQSPAGQEDSMERKGQMTHQIGEGQVPVVLQTVSQSEAEKSADMELFNLAPENNSPVLAAQPPGMEFAKAESAKKMLKTGGQGVNQERQSIVLPIFSQLERVDAWPEEGKWVNPLLESKFPDWEVDPPETLSGQELENMIQDTQYFATPRIQDAATERIFAGNRGFREKRKGYRADVVWEKFSRCLTGVRFKTIGPEVIPAMAFRGKSLSGSRGRFNPHFWRKTCLERGISHNARSYYGKNFKPVVILVEPEGVKNPMRGLPLHCKIFRFPFLDPGGGRQGENHMAGRPFLPACIPKPVEGWGQLMLNVLKMKSREGFVDGWDSGCVVRNDEKQLRVDIVLSGNRKLGV
jgi:hypothetical protein